MIPDGWCLIHVGKLFDVKLGKMLNKTAKELYPQYEYLGNSNVKWGFFDLKDLKTMHFSDADIKKFSLKKNDILMCEGGEVGRCAIWQYDDLEVYYQKALHRLRVTGDIVPFYFQCYMEKIANTKLLEDYTTRTSIAHLTREKLLALPVKLPPLKEQQKIAQILATWDKAIATTEKLIKNSEKQKKAFMQQLLTGKKRLLDENGVRFSGKWKKVRLGDVATMNSGGTPKSSIAEYYNGNIPWVSIADMTLNGKWIESTQKYLTEYGLKNSSAKLYPKNTILYAMYASIGECSIAKKSLASSQAILGIQVKDGIGYEYLYFYLTFIKYKVMLQGQQGTQSNLNKGMVKSFKLLLPEIDEQKKIECIINNVDDVLMKLNSKKNKLIKEKKALMQQLLTGKKRVLVD